MKKWVQCLLWAALTASLILAWRHRELSVSPTQADALTRLLEEAEQRPDLAGAVVGFCLLDSRGESVLERRAGQAFIPASTLKTLTAATVLEKWGPDFRLETEVRATTPMLNGVIAGDLVIVGGADPVLGLSDVARWAQQLYERGVRRVEGRVIGDGRLLSGSIYNDFWDWGDIGNGYGSGVSGLNFEHNRFAVGFRPGAAPGVPAQLLGVDPEVPGVRWVNEVRTGAAGTGDGVMIHGGEATATMHLRGTVPEDQREFQVEGAVPDPERYAAHQLRLALIAAGIEVVGEAVAARSLSTVPEAPEKWLSHSSPPLIEILRHLLRVSDNHETECLFRLLGQREGKASAEVVREHWRTRGLEFQGLRLEDGCGLARANFICPRDLARLQFLAGSGPHGGSYKDALPAVREGAIRWKGGAMSGIRAYTGYVRRASGEEYTFAFMINHFNDSVAVNQARDALFEALLNE